LTFAAAALWKAFGVLLEDVSFFGGMAPEVGHEFLGSDAHCRSLLDGLSLEADFMGHGSQTPRSILFPWRMAATVSSRVKLAVIASLRYS
jgi:hypothetical protein